MTSRDSLVLLLYHAMSLSERFSYEKHGIIVPEKKRIERVFWQLVTHGRSIVPSGLTIDKRSVVYDIFYVEKPEFNHIVLTAILQKSRLVIGFRDIRIKEGRVSYGDGCFGNRQEGLSKEQMAKHGLTDPVPYRPIRSAEGNSSGGHSFFVLPEFRGQNVGRSMFFTVFELAHKFGVKVHFVAHNLDGTIRQTPTGEESYYAQFSPLVDRAYYGFDLS
jgi:GNAT superfamily N-acetyltransferase